MSVLTCEQTSTTTQHYIVFQCFTVSTAVKRRLNWFIILSR